jgi:hypothetical protein
LVFAAAACIGCTPNQRIVDSSVPATPESQATNSVEPATSTVEADVAAMRTADFNFVFVFKRKDGNVLDAEDRAFMNTNTPYEINRKKISDGGRALVIGSNFRYPPENFKALRDRFAFEDFSKPEGEILPANSNAGQK